MALTVLSLSVDVLVGFQSKLIVFCYSKSSQVLYKSFTMIYDKQQIVKWSTTNKYHQYFHPRKWVQLFNLNIVHISVMIKFQLRRSALRSSAQMCQFDLECQSGSL